MSQWWNQGLSSLFLIGSDNSSGDPDQVKHRHKLRVDFLNKTIETINELLEAYPLVATLIIELIINNTNIIYPRIMEVTGLTIDKFLTRGAGDEMDTGGGGAGP